MAGVADNMRLMNITEKIRMYQADCMEFMRDVPDNYYDLAIVDPPYGIGESGKKNGTRIHLAKPKVYYQKEWDFRPPPQSYFDELFRVSKNQIIWGANHFLPKTASCWVIWDKENGASDFADAEMAWTSFKKAVRLFRFRWNGMLQGDMKNKEIRIHPTQKPVPLYKWLLKNYAKEGDKILDTHGGSGSICIACHDMGFEIDWIEKDPDYYRDATERVKNHTKQLQMFL
jgi:site-specific DNA-methyltransferase (adenine-specific)